MEKDMNCMYCSENEKLDSLMLYIADLGVSKLYLFKEQTYYGRCVLAYKGHVKELYELSDEESAKFTKDICTAAKAIAKSVNPEKMNYGMYSDKLPHLHCHLVPKQVDGYSFGGTFDMNVEPAKYLSDLEYSEIIEKIKSNL